MCMIMAYERSFVRIHHVAFHWIMGAGSHQSAGLGSLGHEGVGIH
jgi:hypothetical protein